MIIGKELRNGAATQNGEEVVLGTAHMLIGENRRAVSRAVAEKLTGINRTLPEGWLPPPYMIAPTWWTKPFVPLPPIYSRAPRW